MSLERKERNTFYITHSGELLIWLIIILFAVSLFTVSLFKKAKLENDYNIFMPDVDGLIVGSPVRMMGIEVGHVTKIKPTNNEVFVKFVLDNKETQIPQGTQATVEFSGMAGSKSLELYLPDKDSYIDTTTPILIINPPTRLHDAAGLLNEMLDKLASIIYTSSSFGEKMKFIDFQSGSKDDLKNFLNYTDTLIDNSNKKALELDNKLEKYKSRGEYHDNRNEQP